VTGNIFNSRIKQPIVYFVRHSKRFGTYQNFTETGTRGFELDYRIKKTWAMPTQTIPIIGQSRNQVDYYAVEGHPSLLLGFPATNWLSVQYPLPKGLALNPTLIYLSHRYGYTTPADSAEPPKRFDPACLANLNFSWRDFILKGFDLDLGVYDIFGENFEYIQPYKRFARPLPGPSREFRARLSYRGLTTLNH